MAGQTATDTGPVDNTGTGTAEQQADAGTASESVSKRADEPAQSRTAGPATQQADSLDARIKLIERKIARMQRIFSNHSHHNEEESSPSPNVVESSPEAN